MSMPGQPSVRPVPRSWWSRNWKWATPLAVLMVVIFVGLIVAWPVLRPRAHPQYWAALEEIRRSSRAAEKLGHPIQPVRWLPSGDLTATTAKLNFEVAGPKGKAQVATLSRLIDDRWGFTTLELTFGDGERVDLAPAIAQREGNDTPKFDPNAPQPQGQMPDLPVDIDLGELPDTPQK